MQDPNSPQPGRPSWWPRPPAMSPHEKGVLTATCLASFGSFYTMTVTSFALPQIQLGLSIPEDEVGTIVAVVRFGALLSLVIAVLADRIGRRRLLIASVVGCAVCNVATAFVGTGEVFAAIQFAARAFIGGQILLAGVVVTEELSAENRGFGLGLLFAIGGMGGALTLLVYSFVEVLPYGWRALFVIGGFGLGIVPWLWRSLQETTRFDDHRSARDAQTGETGEANETAEPKRGAGASALFRGHSARLAALVGVVLPVSILSEPGSVFVSKHLQSELGYSPAQVGLLVAVCGLAAPLGNVLSGAISDRFGRRPVTIGVSLLLSLGVGVFYNADGLVPVAFGFAVLMASLGSLGVLHSALSTELFPTGMSSTAAGVRETVATLGSTLGLLAVSLLYGATGSHAVSITWLLFLTPLSPLILLFVPETANRELEEIVATKAL